MEIDVRELPEYKFVDYECEIPGNDDEVALFEKMMEIQADRRLSPGFRNLGSKYRKIFIDSGIDAAILPKFQALYRMYEGFKEFDSKSETDRLVFEKLKDLLEVRSTRLNWETLTFSGKIKEILYILSEMAARVSANYLYGGRIFKGITDALRSMLDRNDIFWEMIELYEAEYGKDEPD